MNQVNATQIQEHLTVTEDTGFASMAGNLIKNQIQQQIEQRLPSGLPVPLPKFP